MTYCSEPRRAAAAREQLFSRAEVLPGEITGQRQAAVIEAADPDAAQALHDWAAALPGVEHVEVVFVNWEQTSQEEAHGTAGS